MPRTKKIIVKEETKCTCNDTPTKQEEVKSVEGHLKYVLSL